MAVAGTIRDPYRIKKPRKGVLFKSGFSFLNEKGRRAPALYGPERLVYQLAVTRDYLWLSPEVAVPVPTITAVDLDEGGKLLDVTFADARDRQEKHVFLHCLGLMGASRKKTAELASLLEKLREEAPDAAGFMAAGQTEGGKVELSCTVCGDRDARGLELGYFFCVGIYPFLGAYQWKADLVYLCERHAKRRCLALCLLTALVGYLGFPGVFVAPFRIQKNLKVLQEKFEGISPGYLRWVRLLGFAPLAVIAVLVIAVVLALRTGA
jgi:hypothetical protein